MDPQTNLKLLTALLAVMLVVSQPVGCQPEPEAVAQVQPGSQVPITPLDNMQKPEQPKEPERPVQPPKLVKPAFASSVPAPVKVVICRTDLTKMLLFKQDNTIMHEVRSMQMSADLGQQPWVTCKVFSGFYAPTKAQTKKWPVSEVELVTAEEFQNLVDEQYTRDMDGVPAAPETKAAVRLNQLVTPVNEFDD